MSCAQKQTHWDPSSVTGRKNKATAIKQQIYYMAKGADYAVLLGDQKLESHVGYVMNITRGIAQTNTEQSTK